MDLTGKKLKVRKDGGPVFVEVHIGNYHVGDYRVRIVSRDDNGSIVEHFSREGDNDTGPKDRFALGLPVEDLDGKLLSWRLKINTTDDRPGQTLDAKITVTQGPNEVPDSPFIYDGPIQNVRREFGAVMFEIQ